MLKWLRFSKKTRKPPFEKTRKRPLESVKIKILKIGLQHVLSWPKLGLEPKFHEPGTFGGFGKREHTDTHTDRPDSCFISIDIVTTTISEFHFYISTAFVASNPLMMMYMMQAMGGGEMQQMWPLMMMSNMMPSMMNPAASQSGSTY